VSRYPAVLLAVALLAPVIPAAPALKGKASYYHPTKEGDKRIYELRTGDTVSETTDVVMKVEHKGDTLVVTVGRELKGVVSPVSKLEVSEKGVTRTGTGEHEMPTPRPLLKLPAKPGDQWTYELRAPDGAEQPRTTYTVGKEEEVEVPAGKFKAIRVDSMMTLPGGADQPTIRGSAWHAPGVGLIKSVSDAGGRERTQVLKSFAPGK
jgi:hypothetical protein